jgi:hypothetical protein
MDDLPQQVPSRLSLLDAFVAARPNDGIDVPEYAELTTSVSRLRKEDP